MKVARIYLRVSTDDQDLTRQHSLIEDSKKAGYYIANVYKETASGARADRPELLRMIEDLQQGDVVIAEKLDRISRLPLPEAEKLIKAIKMKGARISVPGLINLSDLAAEADGVQKIVIESIQEMMMKIALQIANDDYELRRERQRQGIKIGKENGKFKGKQAKISQHAEILMYRQTLSISETAKKVNCSVSQIKRVCAAHKVNLQPTINK